MDAIEKLDKVSDIKNRFNKVFLIRKFFKLKKKNDHRKFRYPVD